MFMQNVGLQVYVAIASVCGVDTVLTRSIDETTSIVVYHDESVENKPVEIENLQPGVRRISGGERITDVYAVLLSTSEDNEVVWLKTDTCSKHTPVDVPPRLKVLDVSLHKDQVYILYSYREEVCVDLIQRTNGKWSIAGTGRFFRQVDSEVHPVRVRSAQIITEGDQLLAAFDMSKADGEGETWRIQEDLGTQLLTAEEEELIQKKRDHRRHE
jgi:hypothetical protein